MSETHASHESMRPIKTTVGDVVRILERLAPPSMALPKDPIGLQVGSPSLPVEKVAVALDASPRTAAAAAYKSAQLLVTHHALIYHPLTRVSFDDPVGDAVRTLCEKRVALYAAHTNLDVAPGGVNDALCDALGLLEPRPLGEEVSPKQFKIVTFIPDAESERLIDAMSDAGAGVIGDYRRCAFVQPGSGTYEPLPGADPYIGEVGKRETTPELRVEMVVDEFALSAALQALRQTHPYEEPAYDVYPQHSLRRLGIGRVGRLPHPMPLSEFAGYVADRLSYPQVRFWGAKHTIVQSVAVVGGSGSSYLQAAKAKGADVLVTGEVAHHHTWEAAARGIALIDASHEATEFPGVKALAARLADALADRFVTVELL